MLLVVFLLQKKEKITNFSHEPKKKIGSCCENRKKQLRVFSYVNTAPQPAHRKRTTASQATQTRVYSFSLYRLPKQLRVFSYVNTAPQPAHRKRTSAPQATQTRVYSFSLYRLPKQLRVFSYVNTAPQPAHRKHTTSHTDKSL